MESIDLATLIVGAVCGIGIIQLMMWIVVVIRHPGYDYLLPDLVQTASTQPSGADSSQRSHSSDLRK